MKTRLVLLLVTFIAVSTVGCANPVYRQNRRRDALDIFSVAAGVGAGAKVRVGYIQIGALYSQDLAGLRMGRSFVRPVDFGPRSDMVDWTVTVPMIGPGTALWGVERFHVPQGSEWTRRDMSKPSDYETRNLFLMTIAKDSMVAWWWQVEVVAGLGGTVRLGFNLAEFADFLLGWARADLLDDDVGYIIEDRKAI
jgi:hypothetical protein